MKAVGALPEGYKEIYSIDLQKDKKMSLIVNLLAILIAAVLVVPMLFLVPISTLFDMQWGEGSYWIRYFSFIALMIVYMLQVINLSGAAGDLFVTVKFSRFPKDILVKDHGVGMCVYSKE